MTCLSALLDRVHTPQNPAYPAEVSWLSPYLTSRAPTITIAFKVRLQSKTIGSKPAGSDRAA